MALVFLYFGTQQLLNPRNWIGFLPDFTSALPIEPNTLIIINGISEIILGILLIAGLFTRIVSFLLFIHMISISISIGFTATGVRDFGLAIATLIVFLNGKDQYCLDNFLFKK